MNWSTLIPSTERISAAALSSVIAIDDKVGVAIDGIVTDVTDGTVIVNEVDGRAITIIDADVDDAAAASVAFKDEDVDFDVDDVFVFDVVDVDDDDVVEDFISTGFLVPSGNGIPGGGGNCILLGIGVLTGVGITVIVLILCTVTGGVCTGGVATCIGPCACRCS
jgi:hypothetical protein